MKRIFLSIVFLLSAAAATAQVKITDLPTSAGNPDSVWIASVDGGVTKKIRGYRLKPTVPAQFNPIAGTNMSLSGSYPNITFNATGGSGETNTGSNLGGGLANYSTKVGVDLRFNSLNATDFDLASNLLSIDAGLKADWQSAYTDRLKWDGGATGLTAATGRTSLGLVIGTDVQAYDADLGTIAGLTPTTDNFIQSKSGAWASRTVVQVKTDLGLTGTNTGDQTITLTGDVTGSGTGSFTATIANSAVTLAKIANIADLTILGNNTGGAAAPVALTAAQTKTVLSLGNVENTALTTWAGTTNLTTLGTISAGTWNGTIMGSTYGGTGINNAGRNLTINTNSGTIDFTGASKTLTVPLDASVSGTNTGDQTTVSGNAGTATALQTPRNIYGNAFDGTAALTQIIASTYGGTANGFTKFSGPATSEKTFTLPNANATLLYDGGALGTPASGTLANATGLPEGGLSLTDITTANTSTSAHGFFPKLTSNSTYYVSNAGALTALALGSSGKVLTSNGATSAPTWETPSGGTPSLTQYRIAVGDASNLLSTGAAITASKALISDANGVPTHSTTTTTQLQYLNAATGTTGTTSTNLVYSTSPTLITPALGTPSALVGTNITGTATSFNINGTVGATTATTGAFTTLSASSLTTSGLTHVNFSGTGSSLFRVGGSQSTYRTTNGGSSFTPGIWLQNGTGVGAGTLGWVFDGVQNGFSFIAGNGTRYTARASMQIVNLNNTAGSEAGDLGLFSTTGGAAMVQNMRISGAGNVVAGNEAAISTSATDGFLYVPTCAGTPTGVPTSYTGKVAIVVDSTNNKMYIYSGGAWVALN